jgi:hypothetical protein
MPRKGYKKFRRILQKNGMGGFDGAALDGGTLRGRKAAEWKVFPGADCGGPCLGNYP